MLKAKRGSILVKTFVSFTALIVGVVAISFFMLYMLMPFFYQQYIQDKLDDSAAMLAQRLEGTSVEDMSKVLSRYAGESDFWIFAYEDGEEFFSTSGGFSVAMTSQYDTDGTTRASLETDSLDSAISVQNNDNRTVTVVLSSMLEPIDEAKEVIAMVLPWAMLLGLIVAAVVSYPYAKALTTPIKKISDATIEMKTLDPGIVCQTRGTDEIGVLAENVNTLYHQLITTVDNLQKEVRNVAEAEGEKLDFLRTASHELKTPITAVNGMIEGMIHSVGVYKNRDKYLLECQARLLSLSALIQEILDATRLDLKPLPQDMAKVNLAAYIHPIAEPYEVIAQLRQVSLRINTQDAFTLYLPERLFSKALSNILSNAVKYTDKGACATVYFKDNALIVENECTPVPVETVKQLFEPFYRPDFAHSKADGENGLGLYLTDRILRSCGFDYSFAPFERGMRFSIFFHSDSSV